MAVAHREKIKRPILRYHGGKWMLAKWITSFFSDHRLYIEPYVGAGSVLMRKERSFSEVVNDLDDEVVNLFRVLRDTASSIQLARQLYLTPWSRTEFWSTYEPGGDAIEMARKMVARSYMAFGTTGRRKNRSGFRGKSERHNSTGVQDWSTFPESIAAVAERLRGVCIENMPALDLIKKQDCEDALIYCDPPYVTSTRTSIRWNSKNDRCYAHEMTDKDHREMAKILKGCKGKVIVSGYANELYDKIFKGWVTFDKNTFASGAVKRTERLWLNRAALDGWQQRQGKLFMQ